MENKEKLNSLADEEMGAVSGGASGSTGSGGSGSFSSYTGTNLNILVSWNVQGNAYGQKTLNVTVYANSYSLYSGHTGVELTANGVTYTASSASVNYSGKTLANHALASFSIPNVAGSVSLSAVWHFNGSYSGVAIGDIRATGVANV